VSDDRNILDAIGNLVEEEQRLREQHAGQGLDAESRTRLEAVEQRLDQCWDLLRQRRASEEFGLSTDDSSVRPAEVVENYEQ
jgi:uncharacterized protein YjaG (DUF416 family)